MDQSTCGALFIEENRNHMHVPAKCAGYVDLLAIITHKTRCGQVDRDWTHTLSAQ